MNNYHNHRDPMGRFVRKSSKNNVVAGRIYALNGFPVRAGHIENGQRFVSAFGKLSGLVQDSDLQKVGKNQVNRYLAAK
jgi:hypothetical protein